MEFLVSLLRYIAPVTAVFVLFVCVVSLFRNRPRVHTLARLVNQSDGSVTDIKHWETSLGKSNSNDIVLPYPEVMRFHAVIAKKRRDWVITYTARMGELLVNGEKVETSRVLENGDIISIGDTALKFECDEALSEKSKKAIRSSVGGNMSGNVAYGVLVDIKTRRPVYLKKTDVLIGRGKDCDIQLLSDTVSSEHARIHRTSRGWALTDLDSHNGTKLNGRYINQPQLIFDEDMLTFGDKVFIFYER